MVAIITGQSDFEFEERLRQRLTRRFEKFSFGYYAAGRMWRSLTGGQRRLRHDFALGVCEHQVEALNIR
jgi:hypothetical protein